MVDQEVVIEINLAGDFTEKINAAIEAIEKFSEAIRPFVQEISEDEIVRVVKDARDRGVVV
jgi:hypothetical protein